MSEDVSKGSVPEQSSPQIEGVVYLIAALTILITVSIIIGALNNQSLIDKQQGSEEIVNRDPLPPIEKPLPAPPPIETEKPKNKPVPPPIPPPPPAPRKPTNFERANAYKNGGDFASAEKCYSLHIDEQPNHHESYFWRGVCFLRQEKYFDAKLDFNFLIDSKKYLYSAYKYYGILWYEMKKYENAEYDFRKALKFSSAHSIGGYDLGHTNYWLFRTYTKLANMQVKYSDDHQYYRGEADHYFQESRKHGYKENR